LDAFESGMRRNGGRVYLGSTTRPALRRPAVGPCLRAAAFFIESRRTYADHGSGKALARTIGSIATIAFASDADRPAEIADDVCNLEGVSDFADAVCKIVSAGRLR